MPRWANEVASPNDRKNLLTFAVSYAVSTWSLIRICRSDGVMPAAAAYAMPSGDRVTVTEESASAADGRASVTRINTRRMIPIVHQGRASRGRRVPDCDVPHAPARGA